MVSCKNIRALVTKPGSNLQKDNHGAKMGMLHEAI